MENKEIPDPDLQQASDYLREQVEICHTLTRAMEQTFLRETHRSAQDHTLKLLMKLVGATAIAAGAMNRLKGTQINQTITIRRMAKEAKEGQSSGPRPVSREQEEGAYLENAKTNGGGPT